MNARTSQRKGLTLVEILVTLAIIALLSTMMVLGLNYARKKGRDAKRIADIEQIANALAIYASDHEVDQPLEYPASDTSPCSLSLGDFCSIASHGLWITGLIPEYAATLPVDPLSGSSFESYKYKQDSTFGYILTYMLEQDDQRDNCEIAGDPPTLSTKCGRLQNAN